LTKQIKGYIFSESETQSSLGNNAMLIPYILDLTQPQAKQKKINLPAFQI